MTSFDQIINEIDIYGFTLVPDVLSSDQVLELKEALIKAAERMGEPDYENRGGTSLLVRNLPTLDPAFFQIIDHPLILPIVEHFLDKSLILGSLSARIVRPGDGLQNFHSDIPGHMLNPVSPVMMNTVWTLVDFHPTIGGTRIVPGSHKANFERPQSLFYPGSIKDGTYNEDYNSCEVPEGIKNFTPKAGDVVVISELLVHGALSWQALGAIFFRGVVFTEVSVLTAVLILKSTIDSILTQK